MYKLIHFLTPHSFITLIIGKIAHSNIKWFKNFLINIFIGIYKPNMEEAIFSEINKYPNFNSFFIRELNYSKRPILPNDTIILSPVDGKISDYGNMKEDTLIQAKKFRYTASNLLSDVTISRDLQLCSFVTLYLAPEDYHRIHAPIAGVIKKTKYIPGSLYSVNESAQKNIPSLYLRNERAWMQIENKQFPYILVFIGASIVRSIIPFWLNSNSINHNNILDAWNCGPSINESNVTQAQYLAHFSMGSTVIMLLPKKISADQLNISQEQKVKFGSPLLNYDK